MRFPSVLLAVLALTACSPTPVEHAPTVTPSATAARTTSVSASAMTPPPSPSATPTIPAGTASATESAMTSAEPPIANDALLDVFPKYPGMRFLCTQHVVGMSDGKPMHIDWQLYASTDATAKVATFYRTSAKAYKEEAGAITGEIAFASGDKHLSVFPAGADYPDCGVKPKPNETAILVSQAIHG